MTSPSSLTPEQLPARIRRILFHRGLREKQEPFDEMLFSASIGAENNDIEPLPTPKTECDEFTSYLQEWERLERACVGDVELQKQADTVLDTRLRGLHLDDSVRDRLAQGDTFSKAKAIFNETTPTAATHRVKLVVEGHPSAISGFERIVELQFTDDDDWIDAQRSICLWSKAYGSTMISRPQIRWEYRMETAEGSTRPGRFALNSNDDFKRMLSSLRKGSNNVSAIVFQATWREAITNMKSGVQLRAPEEDLVDSQDPEEESRRMEDFIEWCESDGSICTHLATADLPYQNVGEWRVRTKKQE